MERFMKRPAGFSSAREDLISNLPDALISQILLYLPTKEAVRTSVLSNRWKSVWLLVPGLDLNSTKFPSENAFAGFIEKFLDFSKGENSCLHKLKLSIRKVENENDNKSCVTRWVDFVLTHKLKQLDVECLLGKRLSGKRLLEKGLPGKRKRLEVMPLSLYISQTLINLRLHRVLLGSFKSVSLPCLKTMHLEHNVYANEACLESLISSCPVLEDLSIVGTVNDNVEVLRVISQSLTSLSVAFDFSARLLVFDGFNLGVLIDAPRLKYLKFKDELSRSKIVSNLDSIAKVEIVGDFCIARFSDEVHLSAKQMADRVGLSAKQLARNFFTGISKVRHMIISYHARRLINSYLNEEPSTRFCNMSCLEIQIYFITGKSLSTFLESCPNLKSFVLDFTHSVMQTRSVSFSSVPQCLLSSLEIVEIKSRFNIRPPEIGVARYFVENSAVLKKLVVHLSLPMDKKSSVAFENLLTLPRRSSICEIVPVYDC